MGRIPRRAVGKSTKSVVGDGRAGEARSNPFAEKGWRNSLGWGQPVRQPVPTFGSFLLNPPRFEMPIGRNELLLCSLVFSKTRLLLYGKMQKTPTMKKAQSDLKRLLSLGILLFALPCWAADQPPLDTHLE